MVSPAPVLSMEMKPSEIPGVDILLPILSLLVFVMAILYSPCRSGQRFYLHNLFKRPPRYPNYLTFSKKWLLGSKDIGQMYVLLLSFVCFLLRSSVQAWEGMPMINLNKSSPSIKYSQNEAQASS